jgi:hypothetical protein
MTITQLMINYIYIFVIIIIKNYYYDYHTVKIRLSSG